MKKTVHIEGMTCKHCAKRVKESLKEAGIKAKVDLKTGTALIKSKLNTDTEKIKTAVESGGYKVTAIE